ncbi:hypothetical protein RND71_002931 [Anisodus tanguticus]|uniref:Uncharacterized protein n=1 Tax=Anisodus tanguticus TaxID=243964 RepID=A0AAE1SV25_9SOLA|nr:hypothetical protein RND71_002931 [Anisodus tanguticus]
MVGFRMNQYIVRHVELYMQYNDMNRENLPLDENNHAIEKNRVTGQINALYLCVKSKQ